ncbi:MAG: hypothetical protein QMB24_06125 [Spirosomataceae bacterium]
MNSNLFNKTLNAKVLVGSIFVTLSLISLWIYDKANGDGNGIVAGISVEPLIKVFFVVFVILLVLLAILKKHKVAQNVLLSAVSILVTFFIVEWFCGKWLDFQKTQQPEISGPKHSFIPDENLGYKPAPNEGLAGLKTKDGETVYDITFETDVNSLRKIPLDFANATKFAQFYGCSMTFGEGVNSDETIPYQFAKLDSTFHAYNFAFSGYGPTQMLARLQDENVEELVNENSGFGVYTFIPDHVNRTINTYTNYSYNHGNVPRYKLVDDKLVRDGTFTESRRFRNFIFDQMAKSNILRAFNIGYPFNITSEDYELTAAVFAESAKEFEKKFQSKRFYVVIYPSNNDNSAMVELLKSKGLQVLDYSKLFNPSAEGLVIPNDEPPTPKANRILSAKLYEDISTID